PEGRPYIDDLTGVMHAMEAPKARDSVHSDVSHIEREVEHQKDANDSHQRWKRQHVQKAEAVGLKRYERHHERAVEENVRREGNEGEREIRPEMGPVPSPTGMKGYCGLDQRDDRHRGKNGTNRRDAGQERYGQRHVCSFTSVKLALIIASLPGAARASPDRGPPAWRRCAPRASRRGPRRIRRVRRSAPSRAPLARRSNARRGTRPARGRAG